VEAALEAAVRALVEATVGADQRRVIMHTRKAS
jgi:hypothetical protein